MPQGFACASDGVATQAELKALSRQAPLASSEGRHVLAAVRGAPSAVQQRVTRAFATLAKEHLVPLAAQQHDAVATEALRSLMLDWKAEDAPLISASGLLPLLLQQLGSANDQAPAAPALTPTVEEAAATQYSATARAAQAPSQHIHTGTRARARARAHTHIHRGTR